MRYPDCQGPAGGCGACSLSSYGRDCRNAPVNQIAYLRQNAGLTQQQLADKTGMRINYLQRFEYGQRDIGGMSLRNAIKLADVLGVHPRVLLEDNNYDNPD